MFAFSQIQPNTIGQIDKTEVPFTDYLSTSVDEALHLSPVSGVYRSSQLFFAKYNEQLPISPELANERYGIADLRFDEPITEEAAQLLHDRKQAELDRAFILGSDQNTLTKVAGMGAGMVASLIDPVNLALMFVPVVGRAPMLGPERQLRSLTLGSRMREPLARGLISEAAIAETLPFPRFASSIIQGGTFMTVAELPKQLVGMYEQEDVGNPIANIAVGTVFAGGIHVAAVTVAKAWARMSVELKTQLMMKGMNDFVQGRDIDVATLAKTDESFVSAMLDLESVGKEGEWPTRFKPEDFMTAEEASIAAQTMYENRIKEIFNSAINKLQKDLPKPSKQTPVVPETAPEPQKVFTSALDEIRQKNARTTAQVQALFPEAKLSRQEAAVLRRQAWGEVETKQVAQQNSLTILEDLAAKNKSTGPGVKRQNRMAAEAAMPNPLPQRSDVEVHAEIPEDVTINHVQQQASEVTKKVKAKIKKAKEYVFHGGPAKLEGKLKDPFFLTTDKHGADYYTSEKHDQGKTHRVSVTYKKPLDVDTEEGRLILQNITSKFIDDRNDTTNPFDWLYNKAIVAELKKQGYDAVKGLDQLESSEIPTIVPLDANKQVTIIKETGTLKDFGFIPRKGKLGKQGFWTVSNKGIDVSVQEDANTLTLVRIERADRKDDTTKGLGAKIIEQLKEYSDKTQKPIRLTAELDAQGKPQTGLEAYYEDLGFQRDVSGDNTFTYLPKGYDFEAKMKSMLSEVKAPEPKSVKPENMTQEQRSNLELQLGESLTALQKRLEAARDTTPIENVVKSAIDCLGNTTI